MVKTVARKGCGETMLGQGKGWDKAYRPKTNLVLRVNMAYARAVTVLFTLNFAKTAMEILSQCYFL